MPGPIAARAFEICGFIIRRQALISNDRVYTGGFILWPLIKIAFGATSFYGNDPLWKMIQDEVDPKLIKAELRIGAVSLVIRHRDVVSQDSAEKEEADNVFCATLLRRMGHWDSAWFQGQIPESPQNTLSAFCLICYNILNDLDC